MKKVLSNVRKILFSAAIVCFVLGAAFFMGNAGKVSAEGAEVQPPVIQGASVRYEYEPAGLRFHAAITEEDYAAVTADPEYKTGILLMPTELLGDDALTIDKSLQPDGAVNLDTTGKYSEEIINGVAYKVFKGYLYDIPEQYYNVSVTAAAYVYYNGEYIYSEPLARSLTYVAQAAYASPDTEEDVKTMLYDEYILPFVSETAEYTVTSYVQNKDGSYGEPVTEKKTANVNAVVSAEEKEGFDRLGDYESIVYVDGSTRLTCYYTRRINAVSAAENGAAVTYKDNGRTAEVILAYSKDSARLGSKNYIYTEDDYTADANFIALEFKGANFPGQVIFGAADMGADASKVSGVGLNFDQMDGSVFLSNREDTLFNTQVANLTGANSVAYNGGGHFNIQNLRTAYKDTDMVLVAGTYNHPANNRLGLKAMMFIKDGEKLTLADSYYFAADKLNSCASGKIYISCANYEVSRYNDTCFTMTRPDTLENTIAELSEKYPESNIFSTVSDVYCENTENGAFTAETKTKGFGGFSYVLSGWKYSSGEYVRLDFVGNDAPGQIIFGATPTGTDFQPVGIGFDLDVDNFNAYVYYRQDAQSSANRQQATVSGGKLQRGYFRNAGLTGSNTEGEFAVIIRAEQKAEGVELEYGIYLKGESGTYSLLESKTVLAEGTTLAQGGVMVTNSQAVQNPTKVSIYKAGTFEEVTAGMNIE